MNDKLNFTTIFLIFTLPLVMYYGFQAGTKDINDIVIAQVANKPNLIHFSQNMCLECRKLGTIMPSIEAEYRTRVAFSHIDVAIRNSVSQKLIEKYNVRVVPTMVFVKKNGETYKIIEGAPSKEEFRKYLDELLK